jgi:hypothetical protein
MQDDTGNYWKLSGIYLVSWRKPKQTASLCFFFSIAHSLFLAAIYFSSDSYRSFCRAIANTADEAVSSGTFKVAFQFFYYNSFSFATYSENLDSLRTLQQHMKRFGSVVPRSTPEHHPGLAW